MSFFDRRRTLLLTACLAATLPAARAGRAQDAAVPIQNLRMPVEHYEDGTVKTQLKAGLALVPQSGTIVASNVVLELYHEDASLDAVINADDCSYNREESQAESDSNIRIERDGIVITGKGFEWQGNKERVKILSMARVVFQRNLSRTRGLLSKERNRP